MSKITKKELHSSLLRLIESGSSGGGNGIMTSEQIYNILSADSKHPIFYKQGENIYVNTSYIKGGELVLGGDSSATSHTKMVTLDNSGANEIARVDSNELWFSNLSSESLDTEEINVNKINCATYAPSIYEKTVVYVNATSGSDEVEFKDGAVYKTLQSAINDMPKNLNGFTVDIVLQTAVSENITIRGYYSGTLNIYMNKKNINGYIVIRDCSAQIFLLGGMSTTDIEDGVDNGSLRPNIQPSELYTFAGYNYSVLVMACSFVYIRSIDIFGKKGDNNNYCVGVINASNVYAQNINAYASNSGWNVQNGAKLTTRETYGRCERLGYNIQLGAVCHICNGSSTGAPSNTYAENGGELVQAKSVTFIGDGTSVGDNTNTSTNTSTDTYNSTYGDSYKVKYSSWRKDNTVRQGDWDGTGMHKGCWFFGNQFKALSGKTISSVKLTITRDTVAGNSGDVSFTVKMHNHSERPSGAPTYLSGWSKNVSLSRGKSITITITDAAVLTAIKNGTMKGFGIEVTTTANSSYGILKPTVKAVVTYK